MSQQQLAPSWRYHSVNLPIRGCILEEADFARLFDIINEKQIEAAAQLDPLITKSPAEPDDQFEQRRTNIRKAFVTTVSITSPTGETVHGNSREVFSGSLMPDRIRCVLFNTASALKS